MHISTPDVHKESETLNTFSMSYEIGSESIELSPIELNGFTLNFDEPAHSSFSENIRNGFEDGGEFYDPTPERPMDASAFLSHLNLDTLVKELRKCYHDLDHFHYPIDAMIRTIIYQRLIGLRHTTQLESKLRNSTHDAIPKNLGFREKKEGELKIPIDRQSTIS